MWELICECISKLSTPELQSVFKSLREQNICTNTQCFETMQDAGFGHEHNVATNDPMFFIIMCAIFIGLIRNIPSNLLTHKPQTIINS